MTPTRKRRLISVLLVLLGVGLAATVASVALKDNLLYFVSPSDIDSVQPRQEFRLGGLVVADSVKRERNSLLVRFEVTDGQATVPVRFNDILPDLFREGQGVIARGAMDENGVFEAREVLAKHDENYMPPEVADALRKAGHPDAASYEGSTSYE